MKQLTNGEALPPPDEKLVTKARQLDGKIRQAVADSKKSFVHLAGLLAEMKVGKLWAVLADATRPGGFRDFEDYCQSVLGLFGRSRIYELISVNVLVRGDHAISQQDVETMGLKRSYELSRLEPEQRTPELVASAMTEPLSVLKAKVQEALNANLPRDLQKESTGILARVLPVKLIGRYEEFEATAIWLDGFADQDFTLTMKQKVFERILSYFEEHHVEELEEAAERRKAHDQAHEATETHAAEADIPETIPETLEWTQKLKTPAVQPE